MAALKEKIGVFSYVISKELHRDGNTHFHALLMRRATLLNAAHKSNVLSEQILTAQRLTSMMSMQAGKLTRTSEDRYKDKRGQIVEATMSYDNWLSMKERLL